MRAIVCDRYGPPEVLVQRDLPTPECRAKSITVRIAAASVNSADWRLRRPNPWAVRLFFGFRKPRRPILGGVISGTVVTVGEGVTRFSVGDTVFGSVGLSMGAYAEYIVLPEDAVLTTCPQTLDLIDAAALPFGGLTALYFIRKAQVRDKQKVLINGATGSVGSAAVQLACAWGAEVSAVCSARNRDWIRGLGAHQAIDYAREDFTENSDVYDVIFDTTGKLPAMAAARRLKPRGHLILAAGNMGQLASGIMAAQRYGVRLHAGMCKEELDNLETIRALVDAGSFKPCVDRRYQLADIVDAHRYVEAGHKRGNVLVVMD
jgi:NADPH:quinone reductase-like Zn-dependent oxidoreductase